MNVVGEESTFAERGEIEALTEQLIKMKQLLAESRSLFTQAQKHTEQLEAKLKDANVRYQDSLECLQKLTDCAAADKEERRLLLDKISSLDQELAVAQHTIETVTSQLNGAIVQRNDLKEALGKREDDLAIARRVQQEHSQRSEELDCQLRQLGEQLLQRNQKVEALTIQVATFETEKIRLDEGLARNKKSLEEREAEIKIAQQHLAKKVKEAARLSEQQEESELRADRLQQEMSDIRSLCDALKAENNRLYKRERELQDQIQEQAQAAETKCAKWEEEYFKVVAQWKETDAQVNKLKQLEEKYAQLRTLFGEIDRFKETIPAVPLIQEKLEHSHEPLQAPSTMIDLFSSPKPPVRIRQNLFDT